MSLRYTRILTGKNGKYLVSDIYLGGTHKGNISLGQNEKTGEFVSVKIINSSLSSADKTKLLNEIEKRVEMTNNGVCSPFIVKFYDYIVLGTDTIALIMEYIPNNPITEYEPRKVLRNLAEGIYCLHSNKILHRNIKPQNIDLTTYKFLDIGMGCLSEGCDVSPYVDPHVLLNKGKFDEKSDIFSLGQVMYTYIVGDPVIYSGTAEDMQRTYENAVHILNKTDTDDLSSVISKMIHPTDPTTRPKANDLI